MSIVPLTVAAFALDLFTIKYTVVDYVYTTTDGEDKKMVNATRTGIPLAIDPSASKQLENIFGGSVSDGDLLVISREPLYMSDMYIAGETRKQSIFQYMGVSYFISGIADWNGQVGVNVYRASRYVNQN